MALESHSRITAWAGLPLVAALARKTSGVSGLASSNQRHVERIRCLFPVGIGWKLVFMSGALVFMAADWALRMISCILNSLYDSRFVCLIVFDKFLNTLIGSFAFCGQTLRISGLAATL